MKWEKAIELFVEYEATVLSDGKKTAVEKAESRARGIRYLLSQMPDLASKEIEEITPEIWMTSLKAYKKSNSDYVKTWGALINWKKYMDLRACLVYAKYNYKCDSCSSAFPDVKLSVDHVVPRSKGGWEDLDNLVCFCAPCNRAKLNNPEQFQEWMKKRAK
jgi:5-methylcytosine-specific restriction endonuclease McrA